MGPKPQKQNLAMLQQQSPSSGLREKSKLKYIRSVERLYYKPQIKRLQYRNHVTQVKREEEQKIIDGMNPQINKKSEAIV